MKSVVRIRDRCCPGTDNIEPFLIGQTHTLLTNAVFFGLAHWPYGSPPGVPGSPMNAFLAYIPFIPDLVIFGSYAVLWIQG